MVKEDCVRHARVQPDGKLDKEFTRLMLQKGGAHQFEVLLAVVIKYYCKPGLKHDRWPRPQLCKEGHPEC
jgi:hypothetical protein